MKKLTKIQNGIKGVHYGVYRTSDGREWQNSNYHSHVVFEGEDGKAYSESSEYDENIGWTLRGTGEILQMKETKESIVANDRYLSQALDYIKDVVGMVMSFWVLTEDKKIMIVVNDGRVRRSVAKWVQNLDKYQDVITI